MDDDLPECCSGYVDNWLGLVIDWAEVARLRVQTPAGRAQAQDYIHAIGGRDFAGDPLGFTPSEIAEIVAGTWECPWHAEGETSE